VKGFSCFIRVGLARLKKEILDNSNIGLLLVGKKTPTNEYGVLDVDGAFRGSTWHLLWESRDEDDELQVLHRFPIL
jgi:hypothetical protein